MLLLFHNAPVWLMFSFILIPLALFLVARGIFILVKDKSKTANFFVSASIISSFLIASYFSILGKEIPEAFSFLCLPFGLVAFILLSLEGENSTFILDLAFILGVFFNACAFGSVIAFVEKLSRRRKRKLK